MSKLILVAIAWALIASLGIYAMITVFGWVLSILCYTLGALVSYYQTQLTGEARAWAYDRSSTLTGAQ